MAGIVPQQHMHIVALAWIYVVLMMAAAEALSPNGTVIGAFFTLLLYGLLPIGLVLYILNTPARKRRLRERQAANSGPTPDGGSHAPGDAVAAKREEA